MATVLSALIAATVAVTGWFIGHELATRRDDRRKRLELIIGHSERQISEFYSPLAFLIEQLHTNAQVKEGIDKDRRVDVGEFMHHNAFLSLHEEIVCVLKTKCHLLEGAVIPQVLLDYIAHFTSEKLAWRWTEITKEPDAQIFNYVRPYPASLLNQLKEDREFCSQTI
jgi:hypothetical protein